MTKMPVVWSTIMLLALCCALASPAPWAQEAPDAHVTLEETVDLNHAEAESVYNRLRSAMGGGYGLSEYRPSAAFQSWKRYNSAPYLSATHGNRYVNNFANAAGSDYGKLPKGAAYPEGTIFAKDSISVVARDRVFPGALFFMEKLATGRSPATADWRYVGVLPDGSLIGDTLGENADKVAYCHECHIAAGDDDYVFFVPKAYRIGD